MSYSDDSFSSSRSSSRASSRSPPRRAAAASAAAPTSAAPVVSGTSPARGSVDASRLRQALAASAIGGGGNASPQDKTTPMKKGAATRKPSESAGLRDSSSKRRSYSSSSSSTHTASSFSSRASSRHEKEKKKRSTAKDDFGASSGKAKKLSSSHKKTKKHKSSVSGSSSEVDDSPAALRAQHAELLREVQAMEAKLRRTRQLDAMVATSAVANRQYNAYNPFSQKAVEQRIKRLQQEVVVAEQENERLIKRLNTTEDLDRLHVQIAKREEAVRDQQLTNQRLQRQIRENSRALAGKTGHDKINEVAVAADRDRRRAMEAAKRSVASAAQEAATAAEGRATAQEKLQQMLEEDPFADLSHDDVTRLISLRRELVEAREYDEQLEARFVAVRRQRAAEEAAAYPGASGDALNALHKLRLEVTLLQVRAGVELSPWGLPVPPVVPGLAPATAPVVSTTTASDAKHKGEAAVASAHPVAELTPAKNEQPAVIPQAAVAVTDKKKPASKGPSAVGTAEASNAAPAAAPSNTVTPKASAPTTKPVGASGVTPAGGKPPANTEMAPLRTPRGSLAGVAPSNAQQPTSARGGKKDNTTTAAANGIDFARAERERRQREDAEAAAASARMRETAQASLHANRQGAADAAAMAAAARRQRDQEDREAAEALERLRKRRSTTGAATGASSDADTRMNDSSDTGAGKLDGASSKGPAALSASSMQPRPPATGSAAAAVTSPRRTSDLATVAASSADTTTGELAAAAARRKADWLRERVDRLEADEQAARAELRRGWDNAVLYTLTPAHRDVSDRAKRAKAAPTPPPAPVVAPASDVPSWLDD